MRAFWAIETADGIFLALRYTIGSAEQCRKDFANRWPQGINMILTADRGYGVRSHRSTD